MIRVAIAFAALLLFSFSAGGHEVVEDTGCIDVAEPDESSEWDEWYLVNTCAYAVDVLWCSLDGPSDGFECGGEEYYARFDTLDSEGRVASDVPFSQDLALGVAACRNDYDPTGFNGLDVDSLLSDGTFTCLIGQRAFGASNLGGVSSAVASVDDCMVLRLNGAGAWELANTCSYPVQAMWCTVAGVQFYPRCGHYPDQDVQYYWNGYGFDGYEVVVTSAVRAMEFDLLFAVCRDEPAEGFYGFVEGSVQTDGTFTCDVRR